MLHRPVLSTYLGRYLGKHITAMNTPEPRFRRDVSIAETDSTMSDSIYNIGSQQPQATLKHNFEILVSRN